MAALSRIETALSRIAAAAASRPASPADPALERRHAQLRASVETTIAELDGLIAGLKG